MFPSWYHHEIFRSDYQWQKWCLCKVQGQRSKVKVTEVKTQVSRFGTITPVWFHIWWWNDVKERCPIDFQGHLSNFKVTRLKNRRFRPKLGVAGLYLNFEFKDGYEVMHKDWSSIEEVPSRLSVKFQGNRASKISILTQNWDFLDCNSSSNSQMAMKWCWNPELA